MAWLSISELGQEYISKTKPKKIMNEYKVGDDDYEVVNWYCDDIIPIPEGSIAYSKPKPFTKFEVRALPTVEFIKSVLFNSKSTREAIMLAISCGGDTDTNASIVGELANYHFQDLTQEDIDYVESRLNKQQLQILKDFNK